MCFVLFSMLGMAPESCTSMCQGLMVTESCLACHNSKHAKRHSTIPFCIDKLYLYVSLLGCFVLSLTSCQGVAHALKKKSNAVCSSYAHHSINFDFGVDGAGQVGGYVEVYEGLTFSTVRNAGHMVPYTQAERAYYMFSHWIHGKNL